MVQQIETLRNKADALYLKTSYVMVQQAVSHILPIQQRNLKTSYVMVQLERNI